MRNLIINLVDLDYLNIENDVQQFGFLKIQHLPNRQILNVLDWYLIWRAFHHLLLFKTGHKSI
jgi:hypothetical protein